MPAFAEIAREAEIAASGLLVAASAAAHQVADRSHDNADLSGRAPAALWARPGTLSRTMRSVVLVFDDQLSLENPVFKTAHPMRDIAVLVDCADHADETRGRRLFRVRALDAFASVLRRLRWRVEIISVDRSEGREALGRGLRWCANRADIGHLIAAETGDAFMRGALESLAEQFRKTVRILDDPRFICTRADFAEIRDAAASGREFYQLLRRREGLLMDGDAPEGGQWRFTEGGGCADPSPRARRVEFDRPAPTASQARRDLERFVRRVLPRLGACEDRDPAQPHPFPCPDVEAMLDAGVLSPRAVCRRIEEAYRAGEVPLAAAEHAMYRLVGLREYRRGLKRLGELPLELALSTARPAAVGSARGRRDGGFAEHRPYGRNVLSDAPPDAA
ncbi:MAG: cryptochrome/photolyase family protein [Pseudomonadota bacterium]